MSVRFESLLGALNAEHPSGDDLEYDPEFARMEKASQGTPDQEFGSTHIEAQPPDWLAVSKAAQALLQRTRDLRVATYLAQAELVLSGLPGLRDALELIANWLEQLWDTVYPQLDPDDDDDPTIRINSLMGLSSNGGIIRQLRVTPILVSRSVGKFSWTDYAVAKGELPATEDMEEPPTLKKIEAAVESCIPAELQELYAAATEALAATTRIESAFSERLGATNAPNLEPLSKELRNICKIQKLWLEQLTPADEPASASQGNGESQSGSGLIAVHSSPRDARQAVQPQVVGAASFNIGRREDAIEGLDKIIDWFEQFEPSSPLPMLLKRAKRLSTMSFIDILRDISPDAIDQAIVVGGRQALQEDEPASNPITHSSARAPSSDRSVGGPPPQQSVDENY